MPLCRVVIASAPKPTPASPRSVMPTPICASAAPQNESGRPNARLNATSGARPGTPDAHHDLDQRADDDEDCQARHDRGENRSAAKPGRADDRNNRAGSDRDRQSLDNSEQIAALPGEREADRHDRCCRKQQQPARHVEERRADGDFLARQLLQRERIERAEEHGRACRRQQQVVEHERALTRYRREEATLLQHRRAPGERAQTSR